MPISDPGPSYLPPWGEPDRQLAEQLGLRLVETAGPEDWTLSRRPDGALALRTPAADGSLELHLDLRSGALARRLATARRDQPLPRAIGLHRGRATPTVLDATAGLGRDALVLARLGCAVTAYERIPALAAMAADAARRAALAVTVRCADAIAALGSLVDDPASRPDVVYLDPMFEAQGKAQVKKDMQVCRLLTERAAAPEPADLLAAALAAARERVVVKRHPRLEELAAPDGRAPSFSVPGDRIRFDVYLTGS